ncbi:MAG TPA: hypothetical protein VGB55_10470 [Tepidisphaeraceae bacterium]
MIKHAGRGDGLAGQPPSLKYINLVQPLQFPNLLTPNSTAVGMTVVLKLRLPKWLGRRGLPEMFAWLVPRA